MKRVFLGLLFSVMLMVSPIDHALAIDITPLPVTAAVEIGNLGKRGFLPMGAEPSGAVWHKGRKSLIIVSDEGLIAELDTQGHVLGLWTLRGDLEAVTVVDHNSSLVYVGVEHPDSVVVFDLETGLSTGSRWDLTSWMKGPRKHGLEALTFGNGFFYAGLQEDGRIFKFQLSENEPAKFLGELPLKAPRKGISGLYFDKEKEQLIAIYDRKDVLMVFNLEGKALASYGLPGDGQEGIALGEKTSSGAMPLFLSFDGGQVWSYSLLLP